MKRNKKGGFTLIEVLLAILIAAIAGTIVLTSASTIRSQSQKTVVRDHTRKIQEAYDQWLGNQPSIEFARSIFNPSAYSANGSTSVEASFPDPSAISSHLSPYLNSEFMSGFSKKGSADGVYETEMMSRIGAHVTVFWDTNYRETGINVILTLP